MGRRRNVTVFGQAFAALAIHHRIVWRPGRQTIHVAVVHGKCRGDQDGVVNLLVGCPLLPGTIHVLTGNVLAPFLDLAGYGQQRLQFVRNSGKFIVLRDLVDDFLVTKMVRRDRGVRFLSKVAIILARNISCDHFTLCARQRVRGTQQNFCQRVQRSRSIRTEDHRTKDSRKAFRETNKCHNKAPRFAL
jgi:hypothetical protein